MERTDRLLTARTLAGAALLVALPIAAAAQPPAKPPSTSRALPRIDIAASVLWVGADAEDLPGENYRTWDATGGAEFGLGYYWTEHVKVAVDAGFSGDRLVFGNVLVRTSPNVTNYVYATHRVRSRWVTPTVQYQFLHNTWVHPFIGLGLEVDWERRHTETETRIFISGPPGSTTVDRAGEELEGETRLHGVLLTGAKFYVSPRVFARTDLRVAFTDRLVGARWGAGIGVDF